MKILSFISFSIISALAYNNIFSMEDDQLPNHQVIVQGKDILIIPEEALINNTQANLSGKEDVEEFDINNPYGHPNGHTPLITACTYNKSPELVELLLKYKANVNQSVESTLWTPLHHACHYSSPEVIGTLIEHGAPTTAKDKSGIAPIYLAMSPNKEANVNAIANTEAFLKAVAKRKELHAQKIDQNNNSQN